MNPNSDRVAMINTQLKIQNKTYLHENLPTKRE